MKSLAAGSTWVIILVLLSSTSTAQKPLDDDGHVVDFERDIIPILEAKCIECHGPDEAKNDFRVDDAETMAAYIEAGDADSSSLYIDYLTASGDDYEDYLMPPPKKGGPLSPGELALIRLWLQEGAVWPEDAQFSSTSTDEPSAAENSDVPVAAPMGLSARLWAFQGYFHPATVHFPVALLLFGAMFVVLGFKWPQLAHPIPFFCLLFGAVSAVGASLMGWSFAEQEGYPGWTRGLDASISRHRWSGVVVTVAAVVFAIIAIKAEIKKDGKLRKVWQIGLLGCAAVVGFVGHIGGELTYGEDFYHKAIEVLIGESDDTSSTDDSTPDESAPPNPDAESVS